MNSIVLYNTMIGEMVLPKKPSDLSAVFNEKAQALKSAIRDLQCSQVNIFRDTIAKYMQLHLPARVIYKDSLYKNPGFERLRTSARQFKDSSLADPYLCISQGDLTSFDFEKDYFWSYVKDTLKSKPVFKKVCEELNVDVLAVSFSYFMHGDCMEASRVGNFTVIFNAPTSGVGIKTTIYFFNRSGDLLLYGSKYTRGFFTKGDKIDPYYKALKEIQFAANKLMRAVSPELKKTLKR